MWRIAIAIAYRSVKINILSEIAKFNSVIFIPSIHNDFHKMLECFGKPKCFHFYFNPFSSHTFKPFATIPTMPELFSNMCVCVHGYVYGLAHVELANFRETFVNFVWLTCAPPRKLHTLATFLFRSLSLSMCMCVCVNYAFSDEVKRRGEKIRRRRQFAISIATTEQPVLLENQRIWLRCEQCSSILLDCTYNPRAEHLQRWTCSMNPCVCLYAWVLYGLESFIFRIY